MDFSHHEPPIPTRVACDEVAIRRQVHLIWKPCKSAFSRIEMTTTKWPAFALFPIHYALYQEELGKIC